MATVSTLHRKRPYNAAYRIGSQLDNDDEQYSARGLEIAEKLLDTVTEPHQMPSAGDLLIVVREEDNDSPPTVWVYRVPGPARLQLQDESEF
jgi:hypothetical protein